MESRDISALRDELSRRDAEIQALRQQLAAVQEVNSPTSPPALHNAPEKLPELTKSSLTNPDILRYSRQLVLPEFGVKGILFADGGGDIPTRSGCSSYMCCTLILAQYGSVNLSKSSVLVVGCGGLGCPVAQYLAASGLGRLGLLDYDVVEMSNLHRQVLHGENKQGMPKSVSVVESLRTLNSTVEYIPYHTILNPANALQLIQQYDVIADCSDNVPTRYLVNDACVAARKPLVSASALRWEGQLTVYNYQGGPCYRCLFPTPPPAETVTNCADGGVLGVVPGIMGCLQALEVLKVASGIPPCYSGAMLMYDALDGRFRNIKIRAKKPDCAACSINSDCVILQDYEAFCGSSASDKCRTLNLLSSEERLSVQDYKKLLDNGISHILIDVRPQPEVDICQLPNSVHIPLSRLEEKSHQCIDFLRSKLSEVNQAENEAAKRAIVICKLGNDSQKAVKILQELSGKEVDLLVAKDIQGGLMAWAAKIDPEFPQY